MWRFNDPPESNDPRMAVRVGNPYLVYAPAAHPFWDWHMFFAVALRDAPYVPSAYKYYPEAEYELMCWACDPKQEVPDLDSLDYFGRLLRPPDVIVQFHDVPGGDAGVVKLLDAIARAVSFGFLSPDSDFRVKWEHSIKATLEHERQGVHDVDA